MALRKTLKKLTRNSKLAMFTVILQLSDVDIFSISLNFMCLILCACIYIFLIFLKIFIFSFKGKIQIESPCPNSYLFEPAHILNNSSFFYWFVKGDHTLTAYLYKVLSWSFYYVLLSCFFSFFLFFVWSISTSFNYHNFIKYANIC